ncbi:hypothetical protein Aph01nite_64040 [Acrocarpospora phusangensis]|uniref:Uncharacterized protein n=1 Tax=Acrocarpospora phusangensis TaxID=1070424 RepID=A0A919QFA0_9ACTN|nr:hypothetical protein [Acrocarpospora phusangensis]GIH28094.1 hypothetical protein Aph01nite_64040 [Acrocarpospora phusangensis]
MTTPSGDEFLYELHAEVELEVTLIERSHAEEAAELPVSEWLYDPADVEREEVGLRGLLDAIEVLEDPGNA